jgi:diguanylate cyclase (GGDEF)-like protein/PAS domain S-box-containing protein
LNKSTYIEFKIKSLWVQLLVIVGLLASAALSLEFAAPAPVYPFIWLPSGLALALLMLKRDGMMGPVVVGLLGAALWQVIHWSPSGWVLGSMAILASSASCVLAPIAAYKVFLAGAGQRSALRDYEGFVWLLGAITLASLLAALPMLALDYLTAPKTGLSISEALLTNWFANCLGILVLTPLIIALVQEPMLGQVFRRPFEWLVWTIGLVFLVVLASHNTLEALFLLLPLTIWAATRFSLSGSTLAISMASLTTLACAYFAFSSDTASELELLTAETLITVTTGASLYVRAILADREDVQDSLEYIVDERTRELQITNFELKDEIFIREQAEKSFRRSSQHFRALFENTSNPIIVVGEDTLIRQWNNAAEALFGYSRDDARSRNLLTAFIPEEQRDELAWKITKVMHTGSKRDQIETTVKGFDGTNHTILWNLSQLLEEEDGDDENIQLILIGQDISEIRETQNQLHYLAHYDVLTNTANRRLFEDRCGQAITSAIRHKHYCALIVLDVDHFKRINDSLGHDAGDELLQELARRLLASTRKEDTIARLGGDEFAILLNQVNGAEGCERVARSIMAAITEPTQVPGGELVITSSIGITLAPLDGQSYEELLKNADMAMYRAKKAGRNNIQFFSNEMNHEMRRQLTLERELREAIRGGQLALYYQPILNAATGDLVGLETLLRWNHPERGLLTPEDFLDVAEQTGQLQHLSEWVIHNACLQARAIQTMSATPIIISINQSCRQYTHPQLAEMLNDILMQTRLDPALLALEIDERVLGTHTDDTARTLDRLKALGVGLILDRYGSGLSSLRLLRELPFDQVKLERELLKDAPGDESTAAIVRTLINLARQLSLTVAASGVETEEEDAFLRSAGCHLLQGHRFSLPLPSDELGPLFEEVRAGRQMLPENQFALTLKSPDSGQQYEE